VRDDTNIDSGSFGGWSLNITTDCSAGTPTPTPTPTPADACVSINTLFTDPAGDQQDPVLPQPGKTQLDIRSLSAGEDYRFINSERLTFKLKVDNLNSIPPNAGWRVLFDFTPPGGTLTTYYLLMQSDANSAIHYEYGTRSGNLLTTLGTLDEGFYSNEGTVTLTLAMSKIGTLGPGSTVTNVNAQTEQTTDVVAGSLFSDVDTTSSATYTVAPKNATCVSVNQPPPPGAATYVKGGMTFSPNYALRAPVASRDGEPSLRVDRFGNAYVAGIRGVPAGVDLWYFDLNPSSPTYDPYMRNPIYRGQPDQFSPDESMEVGADGGGDVDLAVGFDEAQPGQPPYLAFSSLALANVSTARSTDRGATFTKNPVGSTTGGVPVDDRQWMEFYGKNTVYLLYRTVAPTIALVQRSDDGGLTYGPATPVGTIGQVGGLDVDQNDGTVYVSGNTGVVAVGIPPAPGVQPLTYTVHNVTGAGRANIFFTVKVANNGTVYVCYSDGKQVYIKYSKDKGTNWSPEIRISDGPDTATSLLPWLETGPTPGSIGVVWYGSSATSNSDAANWKVFFAQSSDITAPSPTVRQVVVSDHFIHGSNISLAGLPLDPTQPSGNRNLIDYFQIGFDPTGAAVIAFTDDHNDFDGHTYVARQISGPGANGNAIPSPVEGSGLPAAQVGPKPSVASVGGIAGAQVTDWLHDVRTSNATLDIDDPFDVVSIKYSTEATATGPILVTTMKVSDLPVVPPNGTWRVNFTVNAPDAGLSPTGDYNLGLSDRGDQFFLRAQTDLTGAASFVYGTAARRHFVAGGGGGFDYTDRGAATGAFDTTSDMITIKIPLSTLNAALPAGHAPIGPGSVFSGLRGSAFTSVQGNNGRSDNTRGGTVFRINSAPVAALTATPTSGTKPLAVTFNASGSSDPDVGDSIVSYRFNFGDGAVVTQSSSSVSHTYTSAGIYTASVVVTDANGTTSSNAAQVQITVSDPPIIICMEDDDAGVGYSGGWHSVNSGSASAGHFHMHSGTNTAHFARVNFSVGTNSTGKFSFYYGKSTKGGLAEVFVDGVSRGQVSFVGASGSNKTPDFGPSGAPYEFRIEGLSTGQHTFELRNMSNAVFVDGFCLLTTSQPQVVNPNQPSQSGAGGSASQTSWLDSGLLTLQGPTTSNTTDVNVGQAFTSNLNLSSNATAISAVAETSSLVPIKLAVIDPSGLTVQIVDAVNGVAVISTPVSRGGLYTVKVINVGVGPVQVWTLATPTNRR
jgi:PKD repeat protein